MVSERARVSKRYGSIVHGLLCVSNPVCEVSMPLFQRKSCTQNRWFLGAGRTLEEALAWCLVWVMAKGTGRPLGIDWGNELGIGPFPV